jgi:ferredoxin
MIVGKRKPLAEIKEMVGGACRILVAGCGTCVAVCMAGGEKEAHILASQLKMAFGLDGRSVELDSITLERQCDREFFEPLARKVDKYDVVVSLACGAGVQLLADQFPDRPVYPGVDTRFIGVAEETGLWTERCRACGECIIGLTAGICPRTRCAKGLVNGPCDGQTDDFCETDPKRPCAWVRIVERLEVRGENVLETLRPMRENQCPTPDALIHPAYKRRFSVDGEEV